MEMEHPSPTRPEASLLDAEWQRLRDLIGGDDRERVRQLTERLAHLETQITIERERHSQLRHRLARLRPVLTVGVAAAVVWAGFATWQHRRLARVASVLEEIPGLVILQRHAGSGSLTGLRDSLGPDPESFLTERGYDPTDFRLQFAPYASQRTQWAEQRDRDRAKQIDGIRQEFVTVVGDLDQARETQRRQDLESLTRAVFRLSFPEADGLVELALENDRWKVRGNVEEPLHKRIVAEWPRLGLPGDLDTSDLHIASPEALSRLQQDIEAITLVYLSGTVEWSDEGQRQAGRLSRLIRQHDDLSAKLGKIPSAIEVHSLPMMGDTEANAIIENERIAHARRHLADSAGLSSFRLLPGVRDTVFQDGRVGVYVLLKPASDTVTQQP